MLPTQPNRLMNWPFNVELKSSDLIDELVWYKNDGRL